MSRVREIDIRHLDPNSIKVDLKSYKTILVYYIGYIALNSIKPLYLVVRKIYGYIEEYNGNKCLTLVYTDERKDAVKKYEQLLEENQQLKITIKK